MNRPNSLYSLLRKSIFSALVMCLSTSTFAQNFFKTYPQVAPSFFYEMRENPGGIDFVTQQFFGSQFILGELGVTSPNGDLVISQELGFTGGRPIFRISDGNYIRPVESGIDFEGVFERLDADGNLLNSFSFDIPSGDVARYGAVDEFADGDIFVAFYYGDGFSGVGLPEKRTIAYAKVNPITGTVAWEGIFESFYDKFQASPYLLAIAPDGSVYMAIQEAQPTNLNNFICKISSTGSLLWREEVSTLERYPIQLAVTDDGGVAFVFNQVFGDVRKLDTNGNSAGSVLLDPVFQSAATPTAIVAAPNNQILAAGTATPPGSSGQVMYTAFIDENMNVVSSNVFDNFPSTPKPRRGIRLQNGEYAFVGQLGTETFLATVNENGVFDPGGGDCSDSPVVNGGFESGLTGWNNFGAGSIISNGISSGNSLQLCDAPGEDNRVLQGLPINPGESVEFKFLGKKEVNNEYFSGYVKYLTSSFQPIDPIEYVSINTLTVNEFSISSTAPGNAAYIEIGFLSSANATTCATIDDVCLTDGNGAGPCSLSGFVQNIQCQDQNTTSPDDDTYTFDLLVTGTNTPSNEWVATFMGQSLSGQYGTTVSFGPFGTPAFPLPTSISINDEGDSSCSTAIGLNPPPPCSSPEIVCTGDVLLTSQAEVDAWAGCTIVEGNLDIKGVDITDLSPLASLQIVTELFRVEDTPLLTNLNGLENVDSIGRLFVRNNASLNNLDGLNGLSQTEIEFIVINSNHSLKKIDGLNNFVHTTDQLAIEVCDSIEAITGLNNLISVGGMLQIGANPSLTDISGLSNVETISGNLQIVDNDALTAINGLGGLTTVGAIFSIVGNDLLEGLDGFQNLANLTSINITNNPALNQINALSGINSIGGYLNVVNNVVLNDCCGIFSLLDNGGVLGNITISSNPMFCLSAQDILDNCAPSNCTGNIELTSQAEVDAWAGCTVVEGNLRIAGSDITDLSPLITLQKVRGALSIDDNPVLLNLMGLKNVDSVGVLIIAENAALQSIDILNLSQTEIVSIIIYNNDNLQSIDGLNNFTNAGFMQISGHDNLSSITGFNGLTSVDGNLLIEFNAGLTDLGGFANLDSVAENFQLVGNNALAGINGFGNLSTVDASFIVASNDALTNINGFGGLEDLHLIAIAANPLLENLDVFSTITDISGDLNIVNNANLSDCCGVFPLLSSGGVGGNIVINGNPMACSNETEVLDNCAPNGDIDLSISLEQTDPTPAQWTNYEVVLKVQNEGPLTATGIEVSFVKPAGVVYVGGNEFDTSQGSFNPNGNEVWTVGSLPAGGSATLTVNYFLLASESPVAWAEVSAANETDADSSPGNGVSPAVNEDDEASTGGSGPPNLSPDLVLANLDIQNSPIDAGQILEYEIDISNQGDGSASGNFNVRAWISTDQTISPDDIQDGFVSTGNYGAGFTQTDIPGSTAIPAGLAGGQYYLILKVDSDGTVSESNEGNNLAVATFTISDNTDDSADLELSLDFSGSSIQPGIGYTYTATLTNQGPETATNILVATSLAGFTGFFGTISVDASMGTYNQFSGSWNIPSLAAGESATIAIVAAYILQPATSQVVVFFRVDGVDQPDPDSTPDNDDLAEDDLVQVLLDVIDLQGDIDLSVSMSATELNPAIYTNLEIALQITNAGPQTATDVVVEFARPNGTVYTGGNEWVATQGTFNPFGNEQWTVGELAAGETATLTVSYFMLTADALTPYAQVVGANETDGDSTPGNGTCCTPAEDDEATLTLNAFAGGGTAFVKRDRVGRPIILTAINPNPVYHGETSAVIDSRVEGTFDLEVYDLFGRLAFSQKVDLEEGMNEVYLNVSDLRSGTYLLNMPGQNWRNLPIRLVVASW